jgi:gas vesicle protein/DNA-directed RNA polymerase subunit RPC12/RpoP
MIYQDLKCSSCGGNDFSQIHTNQYRCNYCGTDTFMQQKNINPVNINIPSFDIPADVQKKTKRVATIVILGIVLGAIIPAVLGVFFAIKSATSVGDQQKKIEEQMAGSMGSKIEEGMQVVEENGKSYPDTLSDRAHNPNVKINIAKSMKEKSGDNFRYVFWGTYENKTGAVVKDPRFTMEFFNDGIKLNTSYADGARDYLLPDEVTGFRADVYLDEDYDQYKIIAPTSNWGFFNARPKITFSKTEMKKNSSGDWEISGIAENISDVKANVGIIASLYDASGKYLGFGKGYVSGNLAPKEKGKFSFSVSGPSGFSGIVFADLWSTPSKFVLDYNATPIP